MRRSETPLHEAQLCARDVFRSRSTRPCGNYPFESLENRTSLVSAHKGKNKGKYIRLERKIGEMP